MHLVSNREYLNQLSDALFFSQDHKAGHMRALVGRGVVEVFILQQFARDELTRAVSDQGSVVGDEAHRSIQHSCFFEVSDERWRNMRSQSLS